MRSSTHLQAQLRRDNGEGHLSLRKKTVKAVFWVAVSRFSRSILSFITTLILARLLVPDDFGLVAIVFLVINALQIFRDLGLDQALIYRRDDIQKAADTTCFLVLAAGLILYGLAYLAAPHVAVFFENEIVKPVLRVLALNIVISSLGTVPATLLEKELKFGKRVTAEILSNVGYAAICVTLASVGLGVWSIVYGQLTQSIIAAVSVWILSPWRPAFGFDKKIAVEIFRYGKDIVATAILIFIFTNIDDAFVGKILGTASLGFYTLGFSIANLPRQLVTSLVDRVTFPTYSKLQEDYQALSRAYLKSVKLVSMFSIPAAFGIFTLAPDIILTLYTRKWEASIVVIQILSFYGLCRSIGALSGNVFMAIGKQSIMPKMTLVQLLLCSALIYPLTLTFGVIGVCMAVTGPITITTLWGFYLASSYLRFPPILLVKTLGPQFLSSVIMSLLVGMMSHLLTESILNLGILTIVGMIAYVTGIYILTRGTVYNEILEFILPLRRSLFDRGQRAERG